MTSKDGEWPAEGVAERTARRIVSSHLRVDVSRLDDGSRDRQPDGLIHLPAGPVPLEVVTDTDGQVKKLWATLRREGRDISLAADSVAWDVFVEHRARFKTLVRLLPPLLSDLPVDFFEHSDDTWPPNSQRAAIDAALAQLGVVDVVPMAAARGIARIRPNGWNSHENMQPFSEWLVAVLQANRDVAEKLALHGGNERHAFIWATSSSPWPVNSLLVDDDDDEPSLPDAPPQLPIGITHLWVASDQARRGCLYWSSDAGWSRIQAITVRELDLDH
jgi:hypothetical protein